MGLFFLSLHFSFLYFDCSQWYHCHNIFLNRALDDTIVQKCKSWKYILCEIRWLLLILSIVVLISVLKIMLQRLYDLCIIAMFLLNIHRMWTFHVSKTNGSIGKLSHFNGVLVEEIVYSVLVNRWPFNTGDCLIDVTTWACLTVFHQY